MSEASLASALPRSALAAILGAGLCAAAPLPAQESVDVVEESHDLDDKVARDRTRADHPAHEGAVPWIGEAIQVTAKGTAADWPSALATDVIGYADAIAAPTNVQNLLVNVPSVSATGQNGNFETFSIRGSGGSEILILVAGMPLSAQRRAGVPVAFLEPSLLGEISVTRGPSVVHFGPGALGGAVSIEPRWFDATTVTGGYATAGNEALLMAGFGSDAFSIGVARHQAGDSAAPNGTPLNTSFERESATLQYRTRLGEFDLDALLLPSRTENIGKSNSRYPTRDTTYPGDNHTIGRIRLRHDNGFQASFQAHDQYLGTYNQRPNTPDTFAAISGTDVDATAQQTFVIGNFSNDIGIEYLGRRNINGYSAVGSLSERDYSLRDADENAWSLFALTNWNLGAQFALELGGRVTTLGQEQTGANSNDSAGAFTAGAIWTPNDSSRWTLNLASGYRFPTLEERFYTGVTAQGEIIGNPNLGTESSLGIDLGYAWQVGDWGSQIHLWRTNVEDLIQLVDIDEDINGYVNVGKAKLYGVEAVLGWMPNTDFSLHATAALVRGEDNTGKPPYGIPPLTAGLEAQYDFSAFTLGARYTHRWAVSSPGFEEVARGAVDIVDADLRYHINPALDLQFYVRNAFDALYYSTSDELSTFAQERSIGFNLVWSAH